MLNAAGTVLGRHCGVHEFTVGQRKGLNLSADRPRYVVELRPRENQVVVGDRQDAAGSGLTCSRLSFVGRRPEKPFAAAIKIRYRSPERPGTVTLTCKDSARVDFDEPVWGIAPGQLEGLHLNLGCILRLGPSLRYAREEGLGPIGGLELGIGIDRPCNADQRLPSSCRRRVEKLERPAEAATGHACERRHLLVAELGGVLLDRPTHCRLR